MKNRVLSIFSGMYLLFTEIDQIFRFISASREFLKIYSSLKDYDISMFTVPHWKRSNEEIKKFLLPIPPFFFLRNKTIMGTMFVNAQGRWLAEELKFLESNFSKDELKESLREDITGIPFLLNSEYLTSHNSIHQLYHLAKFQISTGVTLKDINDVVEWGGGYGRLARIYYRLKESNSTYSVVDTPLFSCIQWLYLASVLGPNHVNLITSIDSAIMPNKINLIPVCFIDVLERAAKPDLFISTWALSESSKYSQDYVIKHDWFNAKHILLAYQKRSILFPNAERVGNINRRGRARIHNIEFIPGNSYLFV